MEKKPAFVPKSTDEFEIGEVEDYRSGQDKQYSHQALIMDVMRRCNEVGCHEMRPGWFNEKVDRGGNTIRTYIDDTRKQFISSVKMAKIRMACDLDEEAKKEIDGYLQQLDKKREELLADQLKWWNSLTPKYKMIAMNKGEHVLSSFAFNQDLIWFQIWVEEEVEIYRLVLESLVKLTKRLDFYEAELIEA